MSSICLSDVLSSEVLYEAWRKVSSNNGSGGTDGVSIADFDADLHNNLELLRNK